MKQLFFLKIPFFNTSIALLKPLLMFGLQDVEDDSNSTKVAYCIAVGGIYIFSFLQHTLSI
jgi:hypothetical protein